MMTLEETVLGVPYQVVLAHMGFDLCRLGYYRWLVSHGKSPEFEGVRPFRQLPSGQRQEAAWATRW